MIRIARAAYLPIPFTLLAACLPKLPEEKPAVEGEQAGDCSDAADNDLDGVFDCEDDGCSASPDCTSSPAPPAGLAIAVTPAEPTDDDALFCVLVTEAVDPNGDAVTYTWAWSVDGEDAGNDEPDVASGVTVPGQTWTCSVTPSDGVLAGTPAVASVVIAGQDADQDGDGYAQGVDCDDGNARVNPGAAEDCATANDDDCDGSSNEQDAIACTMFYEDRDGDGHGNAAIGRCRCEAAAGEAAYGDDCDDEDRDTYPGSVEVCDARDQDCDTDVDEGGVCDGCHTAAYDGSAYVFCESPNMLSWDEAFRWCEDRGYSPAVITSEAENDWIETEAIAHDIAGPDGGSGIRIGLRDIATEGTFAWWDGTPLTYTNWFDGRINQNSHDCVELYTYYPGRTMGVWNIYACETESPFICEASL